MSNVENKISPTRFRARAAKGAIAALCTALTVVGCAKEVSPPAVQSQTEELGIGSRGDAVRTLHGFLRRYGYFPNEELARQYPRWRPIVESEPAYDDVFDQQTAAAVVKLQAQYGLEQTGILDGPTADAVRAPRCGVPDGIAPLDPEDKYAWYNGDSVSPWTHRQLTWKLSSPPSYLDTNLVRGEIGAAGATWTAETNISFLYQGVTADIPMEFSPVDAPIDFGGPVLGYSNGPNSSGIVFDSWESWVVAPAAGADPYPWPKVDVQAVALHEMGHSLGLGHSADPNAIMAPAVPNGRHALAQDDRIAISSLYDQWFQVNGTAKDIASNGSATWIVGTDAKRNGFAVYKWTGSATSSCQTSSCWSHDTVTGGAVRIAIGQGNLPYIVNSNGDIFRRDSTDPQSGHWNQLPGCAKDIAAGTSANDVWVIGCTAINGGFKVYKLNLAGSGWDPDLANGGGLRIGVSSSGLPWVINDAKKMYRRTSTNANNAGASWEYMGGGALDLGVGFHSGTANEELGASVWEADENGSIYLYFNQPEILSLSGAVDVPRLDKFVKIPKMPTGVVPKQISAGRYSTSPWVVDSTDHIWTTSK